MPGMEPQERLDEAYLDNNATTRPLPEVCEAVAGAMRHGFGNPSSATSTGENSRELLQASREQIAQLVGAIDEQIVFVSGGTEANNVVIRSCIKEDSAASWITTTVEHSSVLRAAEDQPGVVEIIGVDRDGFIDLDSLERALDREPSLVSVQWVNNETGVIQPIEKVGELCHTHGALLHSDAAQAFGKFAIDVKTLPVDFLTFTAHKIHGPQGTGAIYAKEPSRLKPLFAGGDQELGIRPGTENMPGIAGFGEAARIRFNELESVEQRLSRLRDRFESELLLRLPWASVNGSVENRICNTSNICFRGIDGHALVARLDQCGVICSQSSACTNRRPEPSYVLRAMGLSESDAYASVRFALAIDTTTDQLEFALDRIAEISESLRRFNLNLHQAPRPAAEAG